MNELEDAGSADILNALLALDRLNRCQPTRDARRIGSERDPDSDR